MIFGINTTCDISKLSRITSLDPDYVYHFRKITRGIYAKYDVTINHAITNTN